MVVSDDIRSALALHSGGDMRKAITYLQSVTRLYGDQITMDSVNVIAGVIPEVVLFSLI